MKKNNKCAIIGLLDNAYVMSMISRCASVILVFVYTALRSRFFQPALQGESAVITEYVELFALIATLGVHEAYPFYKRKHGISVFYEFIGVVLTMYGVYAILSIAIVCCCHLGYQINTIVISIPLALLFKELNYVLLIESPKRYNFILLVLDVLDIIVIIGLMLFAKAELPVLLVYLISRRLMYLIVVCYVLKIEIRKIKFSLNNIKKYIKFGFVPMITVIMMEINYKADVIMLSLFEVEDAMIGVYSLAVSLSQRIWLIPDAMKDILLSRLTQKADCEEVAFVSRISIMLTLIISFAFILIGYPIIILFFGKSYSFAYSIVLWLLVGVIGMVFYKMIYAYNLINGKKHLNLVLLAWAAITNIILNVLLIPLYGITGAAIASSVSYLICGMSFVAVFCAKTKVQIRNMMLISKNDFLRVKNKYWGGKIK